MNSQPESSPARSLVKVLGLVGLALLAVAPAVVAYYALAPSRSAPPFSLAGDWELSPPDEPGTTRILSLRPDGSLTVRATDDASGSVVLDSQGQWRSDGRMLQVWMDEDSVLRKWLGPPHESIPIVMLGPDEFKLRDASSAQSFRRVPSSDEPR